MPKLVYECIMCNKKGDKQEFISNDCYSGSNQLKLLIPIRQESGLSCKVPGYENMAEVPFSMKLDIIDFDICKECVMILWDSVIPGVKENKIKKETENGSTG